MIEFCLILSMHINMGNGWNAVHPCVRYVDGPFSIGAYVNSEYTLSTYASLTARSGRAFMDVGVATGYSGKDVILSGRIGYNLTDKLAFVVIPTGKDSGVVSLDITF